MFVLTGAKYKNCVWLVSSYEKRNPIIAGLRQKARMEMNRMLEDYTAMVYYSANQTGYRLLFRFESSTKICTISRQVTNTYNIYFCAIRTSQS